MNTYTYNGPVLEFERIIAEHWKGTTIAISEKKAKSNLAFQFKQANGKTPGTKISLPGKLAVQ